MRFLYETAAACRRCVSFRGEIWSLGLKVGKSISLVKVIRQGTCYCLWADLQSLRGAGANAPVFATTKSGRHFALSNVVRIVRAAAVRAGIQEKVSPHWLRHAHASHSLDRGALPRQALGHSSVATTERYLHARPG